jgi:carbon-monoxide dehydrogenase medium subunit
MKPRAFRYVRATDVPHACAVLQEYGDETKILAGGQSLMPMMNFRLLQPAILLDVNRIAGLGGISLGAGTMRIGALTRHVETATSPLLAAHFPLLTHAMAHVAHVTVRNRGTFGGSLSHADPAAELPMIALLLDARITVVSARGQRVIEASDFFVSALTTALEPTELVTAVEIPLWAPGTGWGFEEFARRHGDYALASVAVTLQANAGRLQNVRIAMMGVGDTPLRAFAAEQSLEGRPFDEAALEEASAILQGSITPNGDLNGSPGYRRHLAGALARRALRSAWRRAGGIPA